MYLQVTYNLPGIIVFKKNDFIMMRIQLLYHSDILSDNLPKKL